MSRCQVCCDPSTREFTDADRANCPTLARWLEVVCGRCVKRFALKSQMSEARATAKEAEKGG